MHHLKNETLEVAVLDPVDDCERMGTRYCTGGYIFQVTDVAVGKLLSGPSYPTSFNSYDGQGIPDSFARGPLRDPDSPQRAVVIGVGICDLAANEVVDPCTWKVTGNSSHIEMATEHAIAEYALSLRREVTLNKRTIRSRVHLRNTGRVGFQICWFPHPFFPQPDDEELCRINAGLAVPDGSGYSLAESGFIARDRWRHDQDYYLALDHDLRSNAIILQRHPKVGLVAGSTNYIPRFFPIWGNANTFSWEPYFENSIAAGQELNWGLDYTF